MEVRQIINTLLARMVFVTALVVAGGLRGCCPG